MFRSALLRCWVSWFYEFVSQAAEVQGAQSSTHSMPLGIRLQWTNSEDVDRQVRSDSGLVDELIFWVEAGAQIAQLSGFARASLPLIGRPCQPPTASSQHGSQRCVCCSRAQNALLP